MSLEKIREAIVTKAEKEKKDIIDKAKVEYEQKIHAATRTIREGIERRLKGIEEKYQEEINRQVISLRGEHRLRLLKIKNSIIDNIFSQAIDLVVNQPDGKYLDMLERWIFKIDSNLPGELFFNARDLNRIDQGFIDRINRSRRSEAKVDLNKNPIDIKGGFIFKTKRFEIDQTLDTIMADLRMELAPSIAKDLFYGK